MEKKRVYELAKELGQDSKKILDALAKLGVEVKNHMSTMEPDVAEQVLGMFKTPAKAKAKAKAAAGKKAASSQPSAPEKVAAAPAQAAQPAAQGSRAAAPKTEAGSPPVQRLYNKVDLRKQEKAFRPTAPQRPAPGREAPRAGGRPAAGGVQMLVGGMGATRGAGHDRGGRPPARSAAAPATSVISRETAAPAAPAARRPVPAELPDVTTSTVDLEQLEQTTAPAVVAPPAPDLEAAPKVEAQVPAQSPVAEAPAGSADEAEQREEQDRPAPRPAEGTVIGAPAAMRRTAQDVPDHGAPRRAAGAMPPGAPGLRQTPTEGPRQPAFGGPRPAVPGAIGGPRPAGPRLPGPRPAGASGLPGPARPGPRTGGGPGLPGPARPGMPRPGAPGGRPFGGPGRGRPTGGRLTVPPPPKEVQAQAAQQQQTRRTGGGAGAGRRDDRRRGDDRRRREDLARFERRPGRQAVSAPPKNVKPITIEGPTTVKDLAQKMAVGAGEVIKKLFLSLGVTATINAEIDVETAELVATEMGFPVEINIEKTEAEEDIIYDVEADPEKRVTRPPVVTVMGHVDHGKTSLLDALRDTRVAAGEAGGITQHIGAYQTELNGRKITFLDTPGHEAFTAMRARGAQVTDLVVLVVAADDGVMPQTVEAINHAKAAGVPIIVAINKIDKPGANPERVRTELTEYGLVAEEWGGETVMVQVSAKNRTNLEQLLEMILLVSDVKEPKADPTMEARGTVIEAELDKGRGPVATVLIQTGTLMPGDAFLCGATWGRVRAMTDDKGRKLKKAGPSTPVQILGFTDVPSAGDVFRVMDEKEARANAERRQSRRRAVEMEATSRLTLDDLSRRISEGVVKDLNIIVKADVQGSVEAVRGSLEKLRNEEVRVNVIHGAVGAITESDVMLAVAGSGAIIIGFNVRPDVNARRAAEENKVDIRLYRVIYDAVDDITAALKGMLKPKMQEVVLGRVDVRQTFKVPKAGTIAGAFVLEGKINRNASVRVLRDNVVVFDGKIASLKRFKEDAREVAQGFECGLGIENFNDIKEGDQVEAYTVEEVKAE